MNQYASLLIALPLISAFFIPVLNKLTHKKEIIFGFLSTVTLAQSVLAGIIFAKVYGLLGFGSGGPIIVLISGFKPPVSINLYIGHFAALFALIIALISFITSIFSFRAVKNEPKDKFAILYLLLILGATGMITTGDIFNLFVFMEISVISAYSLTAYRKDSLASEGGIKYMILSGIGSGLFLIGVGLIYGSLGTLNLAHIAQNASLISPTVAKVGLGLLILGLAVESELFPLNAWVPDAYQASPHPIPILFSGFVVKASLYAMVRIVYLMSGVGPWTDILNLLLILGIVTVVIGEISALKQKNVKRMIAYSSIAQIGLIVIGFSLGSVKGVSASVFHMINHAIVKTLLFLGVGYVAIKIGGSKLARFEGLGKKMPVTSFAITVGAISIVGIPIFNIFWSKIKLILAAFSAEEFFIVVLILAASLVEMVYYFRLVHTIWFKGTKSSKNPINETPPIKGIMIFLVIIVVIIGVYPILPDSVSITIRKAAMDLVDKSAYIKNVPLMEVVK